MTCWRCPSDAPAGVPLCPACRALQAPEPGLDHFAVLGLPRGQRLEAGALERAFRERTRLVHPDRFARKGPVERRHALAHAARLNEAQRTLRDPRRRAAHLLGLLPPAPGHPPTPDGDAAFLEEHLAARERLARAREEGDLAAIAAAAAGASAALERIDAELSRLLGAWPPSAEAREAAALCLRRARYFEGLAREAEAGRAGAEPPGAAR